jgi:hypothetical protein
MGSAIRPIRTSKEAWAESRPILRGIGLILLATGIALLANGIYTGVHKCRRIGQWVPVDALILEFQLVNEPHGRVLSDYRGHITFQYEVGGRTLVSATQSDFTTSSASTMRDLRLSYRPGGHQHIRYNPEQPKEITIDNLDLRSFRQPFWLAAWGAGLALAGLAFRR